MMNVATNPPPTEITVNQTSYGANTDFRVWLTVSDLLCDLNLDTNNQADCLKAVAGLSRIVFGRVINEPAGDILSAIVSFYKGYPKAERGGLGGTANGERIFSFKYDINYIILAIRNQSGIDLSYRRTEPFHWWEFLLEFETLEEHHFICTVMKYRAYSGDNSDMLKLKAFYALPKEYTESEQRALDKFNDLFRT